MVYPDGESSVALDNELPADVESAFNAGLAYVSSGSPADVSAVSVINQLLYALVLLAYQR